MKPESSCDRPNGPRGSVRAALRAGTVLALAVASFSAVPLTSQSPDDLRQFEGRASVFEVQVPVNVYSRSGEPVRGLESADFQIVDEGEVQEITGFRVVDLDVIAPDERRVIENDYGIPPAARRHFLFLFDLSFSAPTSVGKARAAAQDFVLEHMHPADLAAVAVHTVESGPQLLVTFTPDRAQLARAIATLGNPRLLQLAAKDPLGFLIDTPSASSTPGALDVGGVNDEILAMRNLDAYLRVIGNEMEKYEKSYARGQISSWTASLQEMARILASVEGRKHVVLFSEGFDGRLLFGRQPDHFDEEMNREQDAIVSGEYFRVDTDNRYGNTQLQGQVNRMLNEFQRANTVIHTVDISGLRADRPAEHRTRIVHRDALFYLANETGGELHEDANDFGAELGEVLESSTVTYLLSFVPSAAGEPGDHRRIKVRARAPRGAQISHRMGYYTPRPFADLHPMEKRLLASDLIAAAEERDDLEIDVLAAPFRAGDDLAYVPVIVEIGGESLLRDHQPARLPVEIYAYVTDENNEMRDFFSRVVTLDLTGREDAFANTGLKYYGHLELLPGDHLVRVLVRNSVTGSTGVEAVDLHVPAFGAGEPTLLPPFFHEEAGSWFLVREQPADQYAKTTVYPFTVNGEPYVPSVVPLVRSDRPGVNAEICLVGYNLGRGDLDLEATVTTSDGEPVEGGKLSLRERTVTGIPGLDKLVAAFDPTDLPTGDYTLEVAVIEAATKARSANSIPLKVLN
ncbi:MAG: VWA domain-containing protein [Acidobacteriota bacterium]|nr:VWA domain-containing protein [Acidobacteriota bacterium]MDE3266072.1 VWA domain-containing protein [Acidobacteriota bacterium]